MNNCSGCDADTGNWLIHYYFSKVHIDLYCFDDAISNLKTIRESLPKEVPETVAKDVDNLLLKALSMSENAESSENCIYRCQKVHIRFFEIIYPVEKYVRVFSCRMNILVCFLC